MANNHILTKDIGNLRGLSTNSIFTRPPNVSTVATNMQSNHDGTHGPRRGYQCAASEIGSLGTGNYDNPITNTIETVTLNDDGNLYKFLNKQLYLYYDGRHDGSVTGATQANPCSITATTHGLTTGTKIILKNIPGMIELNGNTYTITVVDPNTFTLDGVDSTGFTAYGVGSGEWMISFTEYRFLDFSIFTDSRVLDTTSESITCQITANRSARIDGAQSSVNTIDVELGHELAVDDVVTFTDTSGTSQERTLTGATTTSITIDGTAVTVSDQSYINQFFDIPFGTGFEGTAPYTISDFIDAITDATNGVYGLSAVSNGDITKPAAFIEIIEPAVINDDTVYTIDYFYWLAVNKTVTATFPGSADTTYQNSDDFENATFTTFDDVLYISNGLDYPQKYDGQTAYRAGMLEGVRPTTASAGVAPAGRLAAGNYTYAITYEQIDSLGHSAEGSVSDSKTQVISSGPENITVTVNNILADTGWNTDGALSDGAATTVYGPDEDGYQYHLIGVTNSPHTMQIGDTAFYLDRAIATTGAPAGATSTVPVVAGHGAEVNDQVVFLDASGITVNRVVTAITATTVTIDGAAVNPSGGVSIKTYKSNLVFGNIAIVNGSQSDANTLTVDVSHTIQIGDVVTFIDTNSRVQRRTITGSAATTITIDGPVVSVDDNLLIESATIRSDKFYVRRPSTNTTGATLTAADPISNNLRINIWRTIQNGDLYYLLTTLPNNSITGTTQVFTDVIEAGAKTGAITAATQANPCQITSAAHGLYNNLQLTITNIEGMTQLNNRNYKVTFVNSDNFTIGIDSSAYTAYTAGGNWEVIFGDVNELGIPFPDPDRRPDPPPISKYVLTYNNQLLYAGGERNVPENSDNVFFSEGNLPESVPAATNFLSVPTQNDDVSGVGVAGSSLVIFKKHSVHTVVGDLLTSQFQVITLSPGTNLGCVAHASIQPVGSLLYFLSSRGVYSITENQFFPTDADGEPVAITTAIDTIFREDNYLDRTKLIFKRAVAVNYTKESQYLLFIPAEDSNSAQRTANTNSILFCYDYDGKNWYEWKNMNAAGGMFTVNDDLYFHERRSSGIIGVHNNIYKQHRFYRLVDYADHAGALVGEWRSSWADLTLPAVRKKFVRCILFIDRISSLLQFNDPDMTFSSYLDRIPDAPDTVVDITTVNNQRNAAWSSSPWSTNSWSGYQDSFARINLRQGTVAKAIQIGFTFDGIDTAFKLAGFQLEAVPEFRKTIVR